MKNRSKFVVAIVAIAAFVLQSQCWAGQYTDKSYHGDEGHEYKKPNQKSFTGPFDYGSVSAPAPVRVETGKCNCFTFDATKSFDPDKQKLSFEWNFGDGQTSDQPIVQHCYEKAGDYNVTLTVRDSSGQVCDTGVSNTKVNANFPPTAVVSDVKACVGEAVTLDGSSSTGSGPLTYTWNFGDGTSGEGARVSHTYEKGGQYRVSLMVDDGKATSCSTAAGSAVAMIGDRPSVSLQGPSAICVGRVAGFDAQAVGVSKLNWDFGDGSTWEGGSKASHSYSKPGTYTVTVTGDNGQGMGCSVAVSSAKVVVSGSPIADAGENLVCCVGKSNSFDGSKSSSADGSALSYHWDFGDGASADTVQATHAYEKPGSYRVILTVKDSSGSECGMASSSFVAVVNEKPTAVIEVK